jgi:hypothetical protein
VLLDAIKPPDSSFREGRFGFYLPGKEMMKLDTFSFVQKLGGK